MRELVNRYEEQAVVLKGAKEDNAAAAAQSALRRCRRQQLDMGEGGRRAEGRARSLAVGRVRGPVRPLPGDEGHGHDVQRPHGGLPRRAPAVWPPNEPRERGAARL